MNPRRNSKAIRIGGVEIGGGAPIVVQSMTKTDTRDVMSTLGQIKELAEYGQSITRNDDDSEDALSDLIDALNLHIEEDEAELLKEKC